MILGYGLALDVESSAERLVVKVIECGGGLFDLCSEVRTIHQD